MLARSRHAGLRSTRRAVLLTGRRTDSSSRTRCTRRRKPAQRTSTSGRAGARRSGRGDASLLARRRRVAFVVLSPNANTKPQLAVLGRRHGQASDCRRCVSAESRFLVACGRPKRLRPPGVVADPPRRRWHPHRRSGRLRRRGRLRGAVDQRPPTAMLDVAQIGALEFDGTCDRATTRDGEHVLGSDGIDTFSSYTGVTIDGGAGDTTSSCSGPAGPRSREERATTSSTSRARMTFGAELATAASLRPSSTEPEHFRRTLVNFWSRSS
jgi:hypothetical protein